MKILWLYLQPYRMLVFAALLLAAAPLFRALPRPLPLELLGRHSLVVFNAHIVIALFTLAFFGSVEVVRPWTVDLGLLASAFAGLFAVALTAQARDGGVLPVRASGALR